MGFAFLLSACEKQNTPDMNQDTISESDYKTAQKIQSFLDKINNPNKSGETLTVDDAVWNTEAGLNYSYGDAASTINKTTLDSSFVEIPVDNNQISMTDLAPAYEAIEDSVLQFFNTADASFIVAMDVKLVENTNKSSTVTLKTTTTASSGPVYPGSPFEDWNYWMWGMALGYCPDQGDSANVQSDSDAAEEIQFKIHQRKAVPAGKYYYTDVVERELLPWNYPNPDDDVPNDNYYDYLLFRSSTWLPNHHGCLSPEEMNFYLNGTETVIYNTANDNPPGERPVGKSFISVDLIGELIMPLDESDYIHMGDVSYGVVHQDIPPIND